MVTNSSIFSLIIKDTSTRIYRYFMWVAALLLVVTTCTLFIHYLWKFRKSDSYIVLNTLGHSERQSGSIPLQMEGTEGASAAIPATNRPPLHLNTPTLFKKQRKVAFNLKANQIKFFRAKRIVRKLKKNKKRTADV